MKKPKDILINGQNLEENKSYPIFKFKNLRLKYLNKKTDFSFLYPNKTGHLHSFPHVMINQDNSYKNKSYNGKYIKHIYERNGSNKISSSTNNKKNKNSNSNYLLANIPNQNISSNSEKKKISFIEYRHKKYVNHKPIFGISLTEDSDIEDNDSKEKTEFDKYLKTFLFENKKKSDNSLFAYFQKTYKSNTNRSTKKSKLFSMLTFQTSTNIIKEKSIHKKSKLFDLKYQSLYKNKFNRWVKKNVIDMIEYQKPECYFSLLSSEKNGKEELSKLNVCEKQRYQEIIEKLYTVKKYVEISTKNEYEIVKSFLINNGICDNDSLCIEKLDNFLKFIKKKKIEVNPHETFKSNLINILHNNECEINKENKKDSEKNDSLSNKDCGYLPTFIRDNDPKFIKCVSYRNKEKKKLNNNLKFDFTIRNLKRIEK